MKKNKKSVDITHPQIALEWHPTKNGELRPEDVTAGARKKIWWRCIKDVRHEWQAKCIDRTGKNKSGCGFCSGRRVHITNCLATLYPEIAKEWHPIRNKSLTPFDLTSGSARGIWWQCLKNSSHEWLTTPANRTRQKQGCPYCANKKASIEKSLQAFFPELSLEWHPTKNDEMTPGDVTPGSGKKVWWQCSKNPNHEWLAACKDRALKQSQCPFCSNKKPTIITSLEFTHPGLVAEWHPTKNVLKPSEIVPGSMTKIWWRCFNNSSHEWKASCSDRTRKKYGCPYCSGNKHTKDKSLAVLFPQLALEWHQDKNGSLTPYDVSPGSSKKIWWQCSKNNQHEWMAVCGERTNRLRGCPFCNCGWTVDKIRLFVKSLLPNLDMLSEAELYTIFQQNGLLGISTAARGASFVQALKTGKFPKRELEKFVNKEHSLVDQFLLNQEARLQPDELQSVDVMDTIINRDHVVSTTNELHVVSTKDVLSVLDTKVIANLDQEAVEFFIKSAVQKIWQHAYLDEISAIKELSLYSGEGLYSKEVASLFNQDYYGAKSLVIPEGYSSQLVPNLMQRHTAYLVKSRKRIGNWSGTGAGKTLSAIIASRIINAKLTVICCPNNVVFNWKEKIFETYPDSDIYTKESGLLELIKTDNPQYLIVNYDFFQQPRAQINLKALLAEYKVDFIVVDEIHFSKQREENTITQRKKVLTSFLSDAGQKNSDLHVLGMSATPVINNLFEGKTMIELVTGIDHSDLNVQPTVSNCISMYQKFILHGIRWMPRYNIEINLITQKIDCTESLDEIKKTSKTGKMIDLEILLTKFKLPFILQSLQPKTVIYTHYRQGIEHILYDEIVKKGWRVGFFNGESKDGLTNFIDGNVDILIATSCVGTGIDGLQKVCNRLIVNSLPWTHAEFEQLKGRIYRQGQEKNHVDVIVPLTFAEVNGERWSWCESRWKRIQFKKSIADAAVDGVIPEGHLRSTEQAYKDAMKWLERLDKGKVLESTRQKIYLPLSDEGSRFIQRRIGDLSLMNQKINRDSSHETHKRFLENPEEWHDYHAAYRQARADWEVVPYQEAIKWCQARPHLVIGDFGCGEAFLARELKNKIYSFDHVSINQNVIASDIAHVPLEAATLDAVIFSLSLMGANFIDYLKEANRCLKLDGHLWISEPSSRLKDLDLFKDLLERLGFDVRKVTRKWKFTFIESLKSDREINLDVIDGYTNKDFFD